MKALITGASSGIGRDMARGLARRGYDLILVARRTERLEELGRTLPVQVQTISLDLAQKGNCRALYEQVKDQDLDILINNAGRGLFGPFDETDLEEELAMLDINTDEFIHAAIADKGHDASKFLSSPGIYILLAKCFIISDFDPD